MKSLLVWLGDVYRQHGVYSTLAVIVTVVVLALIVSVVSGIGLADIARYLSAF